MSDYIDPSDGLVRHLTNHTDCFTRNKSSVTSSIASWDGRMRCPDHG
jgi:hypothetical protein